MIFDDGAAVRSEKQDHVVLGGRVGGSGRKSHS